MIKKISIAIIFSFCSCKQIESNTTNVISKEKSSVVHKSITNINWFENFKTDTIIANEIYWKNIIQKDSLKKEFKTAFSNSLPLRNKTIKFLWQTKAHDILINQDYCKTISEPERAALSYLAMEALSDGKLDKSRKECTIQTALDLDYQCSFKYKCYLELWFRNDSSSLNKIYKCDIHSNMSSVQNRFDEITLTVKGNKIYIDFELEGFNRDIWHSRNTGNAVFLVEDDNIRVVKEVLSQTKYIYYYPNGSGEVPPKGYKSNGHGEYCLPKKKKSNIYFFLSIT